MERFNNRLVLVAICLGYDCEVISKEWMVVVSCMFSRKGLYDNGKRTAFSAIYIVCNQIFRKGHLYHIINRTDFKQLLTLACNNLYFLIT